MDDYISREEAVEALRTVFDTEAWDCTDGGHLIRYEDAECALKEITAADVRPVVHGEWIKSPECPEEYDICSVCGLNDKHRSRGNAEHPAIESIPPFCKWCGADMRKENDGNV